MRPRQAQGSSCEPKVTRTGHPHKYGRPVKTALSHRVGETRYRSSNLLSDAADRTHKMVERRCHTRLHPPPPSAVAPHHGPARGHLRHDGTARQPPDRSKLRGGAGGNINPAASLLALIQDDRSEASPTCWSGRRQARRALPPRRVELLARRPKPRA
eukprot:6557149-Prymnesium_polylepis.1